MGERLRFVGAPSRWLEHERGPSRARRLALGRLQGPRPPRGVRRRGAGREPDRRVEAGRAAPGRPRDAGIAPAPVARQRCLHPGQGRDPRRPTPSRPGRGGAGRPAACRPRGQGQARRRRLPPPAPRDRPRRAFGPALRGARPDPRGHRRHGLRAALPRARPAGRDPADDGARLPTPTARSTCGSSPPGGPGSASQSRASSQGTRSRTAASSRPAATPSPTGSTPSAARGVR